MGKTYKKASRFERDEDTVFVPLDEIHISDSTVDKLIRRDGAQIEHMRERFECGQDMVRVVLHHRAGGGYNIEDGRHRVIAAKMAGISLIEALVV